MFKKKPRKETSPEQVLTNEPSKSKNSQESESLQIEEETIPPQNSQTTQVPCTEVNSDNVNAETPKETNDLDKNYEPLAMTQDLKEREPHSLPDEDLKPNQPKTFSYPKRPYGREERSFLPAWYDRWTWLHYDVAEDRVFCVTCQNAHRHDMLNDIKVEDAFIKTGYSHWKHATSKDKGFIKHESSNCHQQAALRLIKIPRTTADVSEMLSNDLIETQKKKQRFIDPYHFLSSLPGTSRTAFAWSRR